MSDDPLVSILVPVRNGERLVGRTLASAQAQSYGALEIIVVDDGSTDGTAAVIEALAARDPRIRLFRRANAGVSASRNFAASHARGSMLAPLDADDLWHRDKLTRQVAAMQSSPKVGVVYSWSLEIDEDDSVIFPVRDGRTAAGNVLFEVVAKAGIIDSGGNSLIRRSCFEAVGGYDESLRYGEDWKLYLSLAEICEYAVVAERHVGYRRTTSGASRNLEAMAAGLEQVSRWIVERRPELPTDVIGEMIYNRCCYVTHLAFTTNNLAAALRYQARGFAARPAELLSSAPWIFSARLLARFFRVRRSDLPTRQRRISFYDFNDSSVGAPADGP
jgi:glycosyltransferase involved in cell wall biosynthesis